ncbi:SCO5555 family protein [Planomonospora algeriensis]
MAADDGLTRSERELARLLREAHSRVRVLPVPPETRQRLAKHLLAICGAAKQTWIERPHAWNRS